jgi:hypothetical protein
MMTMMMMMRKKGVTVGIPLLLRCLATMRTRTRNIISLTTASRLLILAQWENLVGRASPLLPLLQLAVEIDPIILIIRVKAPLMSARRRLVADIEAGTAVRIRPLNWALSQAQ